MSEKNSQRRRHNDKKRSLNTDNELINEKPVSSTSKLNKIKNKKNLSSLNYLLTNVKSPKSILIISILVLIVSFTLYKFSSEFLYVEHTNRPTNIPKLVNVNEAAAERFWGTYR